MKIKALFIVFFTATLIFGQTKTNEMAGKPAAFSRLGFGARGMGMGNAMTAITEGNLVSYYNPALSPFQEGNAVQSAYSVLSLDRSLNFVSFTKKFVLGREGSDTYRPVAGLSAGIINSGVSNIDGRDNQGLKTKELSTSENQFFIAVSNRFSEKLSIGIGVKFYYYDFYEDVTASALGLDIGALYKINDQFQAAFVITDINAKYKWDTTPIYEEEGLNTTEEFPILKKFALSYNNRELGLLAAAEWEGSNAGTSYLRVGAEYVIESLLYLRLGVDKFNLLNTEEPVRPSAGFSVIKDLSGFNVGVDYAFVIEPYSEFDQHIIGLNVNF